MPIKLYASTVVKATSEEENELADQELAKMSEGEDVDKEDFSLGDIDINDLPVDAAAGDDLEDDLEEEAPGFLDEEDDQEDLDLESEEDDSEDEEESSLANVFDLLAAFFKINPKPNDQEFHALAVSISMAPEDLEAMVYQVMSIMMEDEDSKEAVNVAVDEAEELDPAVEEADVAPYSPAEAEEDGAPDLDTLPVNAFAKRLRYSLSRR